MKKELSFKEKDSLVEKEFSTLAEKLEGLAPALKEIKDLKVEIKGLKLFLGRVHPEFKSQFPVIMKKLGS